MTRIAVVVVTYGAHGLLNEHLATIKLARIGAEVYVVDNYHSATERSAIQAIAEAHGWHLLAMPGNAGFGPGVNAGVAAAARDGAEYVLVLNPDATVEADVIAELARESAERHAVVAPRIVRPDGSTWFRGGVLHERTGRVGHGVADAGAGTVPWLTGACLMLPVDLFEAVGGFDPDYFLYMEDVDLSRRCAAAGAALVVRDDLTAVHAVGATQQDVGKSPLYYRYNCRNRLLFAAKHLSRAGIIRWLLWTPAVHWGILMRGGRRQLVTEPAVGWAALQGTLAGSGYALLALLGRRPKAAS